VSNCEGYVIIGNEYTFSYANNIATWVNL